MNREEAEEYTAGLGQVFGGGFRLILNAQKLGVAKALGMTLPEWVESLGGYVRLPIPERREAVTELAAEGMSDAAIGEVLGVGSSTVQRDRTTDPNGQQPFPQLVESVASGAMTQKDADTLAADAVAMWPDDRAEQERRIANAVEFPIPNMARAKAEVALQDCERGMRKITKADVEALREVPPPDGLAKKWARVAHRADAIREALERG